MAPAGGVNRCRSLTAAASNGSPPPPPTEPEQEQEQDHKEEEDPALLQQLIGTDDQNSSSNRNGGITDVSASVLLLPASPDFLRFQGMLRIEAGAGAGAGAGKGEEEEGSRRLALPLALECGAPGGPVLLETLRGSKAFGRLWAAVVTAGYRERLASPACSRDVGSFAAELGCVLEEALGQRLRRRTGEPAARHPAKGAAAAAAAAAAGGGGMRPRVYLRLLRELEALGWDHVESLACSPHGSNGPAPPTLVLRHTDARGRAHSLRLSLGADHPLDPPTAVAARLPGGAAFEPQPTLPGHDEGEEEEDKGKKKKATKRPRTTTTATGPASSQPAVHGHYNRSRKETKTWALAGVLRQFAARVAACQPVWEVLDDLDAHCRLLGDGREARDPGCVTRRLVLPTGAGAGAGATHASVVVKIDPRAPRGVCEAHFIGPEGATRPLQERVYHRLALWDASKLPRENLEALLGLRFPPPLPSTAGEGEEEESEQRAECAVCYAYRLEEEATEAEDGASASNANGGDSESSTTPTVACDNPQCARLYHPRCLRRWLATLPEAARALGGGGGRGLMMGGGTTTLLGSCPYCTAPIALEVGAGGAGE